MALPAGELEVLIEQRILELLTDEASRFDARESRFPMQASVAAPVRPAPPAATGGLVIQSWDTATTEGELADYSVGLTFVARDDLLFLVDGVRERLVTRI